MQLLLLISTLLDRFLGQHIDSKEACMHGVLGATVLLVAITILRVTISAIKKTEALGLGDMKMLAIIGFYIGLYKLPIYLCLSGIFGIVTAFIWKILRRGNKFPFAPSLCLAAFVQLFLPKIENLMDFIALMS
jgi:prepilin signal peptidase PulO-like enzyme (type II secretory pathway)